MRAMPPPWSGCWRSTPSSSATDCDSPGQWLHEQIGPAVLDQLFKDPYLLWFVTEDAVRTGQLSQPMLPRSPA